MNALAALLVVAVLVFWLIGGHHRLADLRARFKAAFAQIDAQLKHRYELIPRVVEIARSYMKHERETLDAVIRARDAAQQADLAAAADPGHAAAIRALIDAEARLSGALGKLFALAEAYPDLKADPELGRLNEELTATESRIAFARQGFNDAVAGFNTAARQFPSSLIATLFAFHPAAAYGDRPRVQQTVR